MLERLKWYVVNVALTKYAPMGAMAALATFGAFMAAHAGLLQQWGVTYGNWPINFGTAPTGPCLVVELDTLSKAAIAGIVGIVSIMARATEHHVATTITPPVEGGSRATDPPPAKE
jgi:hypothetical protein